MTRARPLLPLVFIAGVAACSDHPIEPVGTPETVAALGLTSGIDDETDFQDALDDAAASASPSIIALEPGVTIVLTDPLVYTGSGKLTIQGRGATIEGPDDANAFEATGGGDLVFDDLTVEEAGEHGIYVEVPGGRSGTQSVVVRDVVVRDNGFGGLWVDDQVNNSPASLSVQIFRSEFSGNNTAGVDNGEGNYLTYDEILALADKDGVRVNEGGDGDLRLLVQDSEFHHNQADALELDETGDGDVVSQVFNSTFNDNGDQEIFPADVIPDGYVPIAPEDYDDALEEYQGEGRDLEDGFDIDENDEGSVWAQFANVTANGNEDEGIDLDETFDGSLEMVGSHITANDNFGTGIKLTESEEQPGTTGDVVVNLKNVTANDSRESRGMRIEEFQAGDVLGQIVGAIFDHNDSDGLRIEEYDDGDIDLRVQNASFTDNDGDGIQAGESGTVILVNPFFDGNDDDDINEDGATVVTLGG